jgi:hypothetical protein
LEIERGSTRSQFVENLFWKGLWTCRKTDYGVTHTHTHTHTHVYIYIYIYIKDKEEDVSNYWIILRKREGEGVVLIAPCGELMEEAMYMS